MIGIYTVPVIYKTFWDGTYRNRTRTVPSGKSPTLFDMHACFSVAWASVLQCIIPTVFTHRKDSYCKKVFENRYVSVPCSTYGKSELTDEDWRRANWQFRDSV